MPPTEEEELEQSCIDIVTLFRYSEEGFLIKLLFIEGKAPAKAGTGKKSNKEEKRMAKVEMKQPVVAEIAAQVKDAQSIVLVDYRGLTVEQDTNLRKEFREAGITYKVYKNTMMNLAFKGTEFEIINPYLEGPSAIAVSKNDVTAPARIIAKFAKTAPALEMKGGIVEGVYYDAAGMASIALIPSREELLSKLLGSIQSPITNFARVIKQLAEKGGVSGSEISTEEKSAVEEVKEVAVEAEAVVEEVAAAETEA